jgi:hypothetical protein
VADFESFDGTNQAGSPAIQAALGYDYVGFYAYNDGSAGSVMIPAINNDGVGDAKKIESCSDLGAENDAMYFSATGFVGWGAGLGLDWGGPHNTNCDVAGALDCLQIGIDDTKFALATAEADQRCQDGSGNVDNTKIDCLMKGKVLKQPMDVSAYKGIGFWIMAGPNNQATEMKVTFPIPATVRFYGGATGCSDDDTVDTNDCFNDYNKKIKLPKDPNKWEYYQILFDEITWDTTWGLQLNTLGYDKFPKNESIGLKFQIDSPYNAETFDATELYIDDVTLIPNAK